jgi:hypothetical protein
MGNQFGVGAFCNNITECSQLPEAHLCATLGSPGAHFCTMRCQLVPEGGPAPDGGFTTDCGQGATCTCRGTDCGCTPNMCLGDGG